MKKQEFKLYNKLKRCIDVIFAFVALIFLFPCLIIFILITGIDTKSSGIFTQKRIGRFGKVFTVYKLRTMHKKTSNISLIGKWFRKTKMDELPQLINIIEGSMTFVGPRPDIPGYYDKLEGEERKLLELKPGLTSYAALKFYNEEELLMNVDSPKEYNDTILFPQKIKLNLEYYEKRSLLLDLKIIRKTIVRIFKF